MPVTHNMSWDRALEIVIHDTRTQFPDDPPHQLSDVELLDHVLDVLSYDQLVRYDLETDDPTDPYALNAIAHVIFLRDYHDPTRGQLLELVTLLSSPDITYLSTLQELWVHRIRNGRIT